MKPSFQEEKGSEFVPHTNLEQANKKNAFSCLKSLYSTGMTYTADFSTGTAGKSTVTFSTVSLQLCT